MPSRLPGILALFLVVTACASAVAPSAHQVHEQLPLHQAVQQQQHQLTEPQSEAFFERCSQQLGSSGLDWVKYGDACYRYFEEPKYWYVAERECIEKYNGHLVSVKNKAENGFLSKLTYCQKAWLGRFAVDADRMGQPGNYRHTDGTDNSYSDPHNFTHAVLHHPLVYAWDLQWWNDVYHGKQKYVCKVKSEQRVYNCSCPGGWKELNGYCYYMPPFEATYIEGDYLCRGSNAYLASVHNAPELRAMSLLDLDNYGCPSETWVGLVKLNPCREDLPSAKGANVCYRWSDRSGDYKDFPKWMPSHPINDRETNCVVLKDREIKTVPCYTRARFVCKKRIGQ